VLDARAGFVDMNYLSVSRRVRVNAVRAILGRRSRFGGGEIVRDAGAFQSF
jgi:hypothetical protein